MWTCKGDYWVDHCEDNAAVKLLDGYEHTTVGLIGELGVQHIVGHDDGPVKRVVAIPSNTCFYTAGDRWKAMCR